MTEIEILKQEVSQLKKDNEVLKEILKAYKGHLEHVIEHRLIKRLIIENLKKRESKFLKRLEDTNIEMNNDQEGFLKDESIN